MARITRGKSDEHLRKAIEVLAKYESKHPRAEVELYRQNSVSLRIRIVDPDFAKSSPTNRHNRIWKVLEELPENVQSEISILVLLTPDEKGKSFASMDFDDPVRSNL